MHPKQKRGPGFKPGPETVEKVAVATFSKRLHPAALVTAKSALLPCVSSPHANRFAYVCAGALGFVCLRQTNSTLAGREVFSATYTPRQKTNFMPFVPAGTTAQPLAALLPYGCGVPLAGKLCEAFSTH